MPTTHWSVILRTANDATTTAQQALETLCRTYWYPLYAYLRRDGRTSHEAQDLTQGFFAHLLRKSGLGSVERKEGMRFRSWLLSALRNYTRDEWRKAQTEKRGGGESAISIDAEEAEERYGHEPADPTNPAKLYERKWAMELLGRVLTKLEEKYASKSGQALFAALQPFVLGNGDPSSLRELGRHLGMKPATVGVEISRLRARYRQTLRAEIANTVATTAEIEEELGYLYSVMSA
jgi:RNA polymerase sigma-70 factor (ECF subfamily)